MSATEAKFLMLFHVKTFHFPTDLITLRSTTFIAEKHDVML